MIYAALTLDHEQFAAAPRTLEYERFRRARDEIRDHAIDRNAPAGDHDSRLSRGHELRARAACVSRARELERRRHLARRAVAPDGQQDARRNGEGCPAE